MTGPAIAWAIEALVASSLLMAAVLLARGPARRAFGPQVAYALWALPALRLLLPPLPAEWSEQAAMPISRASEVLILPATTVATAAEPSADIPWALIALAAWGIGAGAFFILHLLRHRAFCRRLLADAEVLDEVEGIRVIESDAASGPLAFGTLQRFVAFPRDFAERYDAEERELALLHELGHHQRRDLWANWAALAVLALHWFNPLAWHAFRAFRCDQELANDARVLARRGRADRHIYACAIVKAAHGGHVSAACHLHTIADLKGRLRMLTRARPSRRRLAAGATAVVGVVAAGLTLTASGTRAAAAVTETISETVRVNIAAPAVPTAPSAPTSVTVVETPRGKTRHRVVVSRDGETRVYEGEEARRYLADNPMPPAPTPPIAPEASASAPTPPAPPAAPATGMFGPTRLRLSENGAWRSFNWGKDGPVRIRTPQVVRRACVDGTDGTAGQFGIERGDKDARVTIVCQNRIDRAAQEGARRGEAMARDARFQADVAQMNARMARMRADSAQVAARTAQIRAEAAGRDARRDAEAGIRSARNAILADRNLSTDQRRDALAGLADAEAELRSSRD